MTEELDHQAGKALLVTTEQANEEERKTQSQILIDLCSDMTLFHNDQGEGYAKIKINNHHEIWKINSKRMNFILIDRYMGVSADKVPSDNALKETKSALEAKAVLRGKKVRIHTRIAETDEAIYIDLCNDDWEVIEIKKDGWKIISEPPVYFKRSETMKPLPKPSRNGRLDDLKPFINYNSEDDFKLIISWLLSTLKENNPFPILTIQGEQGSAKSTTTKILRKIIDPSTLPLRRLPKDEQVLAISASNTWILAYDNLSGLSTAMSDSLCKLSTGGGLSVRELFTTSEEAVFNIMRPSILNGIDDIAQRPDLLDRSIIINLTSITEEKRVDEKSIWKIFNQNHSSILGALCDIASSGLKELPNTFLERHPRMADFAKWISACEKALNWSNGEFIRIYKRNMGKAIDQGIESNPLAVAVQSFMSNKVEWEGTPTEMLIQLKQNVGDHPAINSKSLPAPNKLRSSLRRIASPLRTKGIEFVEMTRTAKGGRLLLKKLPTQSTQIAQTSINQC
ncbi:hypothetical protein [Bacillus nitroreducens]